MQILPDRPIVLTIAGFDPSGCAGLLADIKTFEANGVHGMAVCTANTIQNVNAFKKANWVDREEITRQLSLLQEEVNFDFVKIGLVESFELMQLLVDMLIARTPGVKIVWDPVCSASAGFTFHTRIGTELLEKICSKLFLITPNLIEQEILTPGRDTDDAGMYLSQFCNVLIKGGHGATEQSTDILYTKTSTYHLETTRIKGVEKRGTGCVLSSAIVANLAKGEDVRQACVNAKSYINHYLGSSRSLIGSHSYENQ